MEHALSDARPATTAPPAAPAARGIRARRGRAAAALMLAAGLAACGGAGDAGGSGNANPTLAQRSAAASATAASDGNACAPIRPFYWEIGDRGSALAAGSVNSATDPTVVDQGSVMAIASASKWLYGAYVAQLRRGTLSDDDIRFLTFRSGYTRFGSCKPGQSVDDCVADGSNGVYVAATDGRFSYGGGHMEKHASLNGLGPLHNAELATEIRAKLGNEIALGYSQPQLAGGVYSSAGDYARFLRKLLDGQLQLGALLGTHKVCTNPDTCAQALNTPVPAAESWSYSLGHWVEDDPLVGDGAFSSAGAFGFYPWIDAGKRWYGIVARRQLPGGQDLDESLGEGYRSVLCGRLIRKAWLSGIAG